MGTASDDDSDWSGGDGAAFGTRGESNTGGYGNGQMDTESFDGQIALIRVYNSQILASTEVIDNYNAVTTSTRPIRFSSLSAVNIKLQSAQLSTTVNTNLTSATLLWDTADKGSNLLEWSNSKNLGAQSAGRVTSDVTGLTAGTPYFFRFYGQDATINVWSASGVFSTLPLITVLNTTSLALDDDNGSNNPYDLENTPYAFSFDAGATADKVVVTVCSELRTGGPIVVSYDGQSLALATSSETSGRAKGIYYLDNPYAGGAADLVIDTTACATVNGAGISVISISGSEPGVAVATGAVNTTSISITPMAAGSLVVAAFAANDTQGTDALPPLVRLLSSGNIGSACAAAGYEANVPAAGQTYSFTTGSTRNYAIAAAAFSPKSKSSRMGTLICIR